MNMARPNKRRLVEPSFAIFGPYFANHASETCSPRNSGSSLKVREPIQENDLGRAGAEALSGSTQSSPETAEISGLSGSGIHGPEPDLFQAEPANDYRSPRS